MSEKTYYQRNREETDLVTFTEEILNGNFYFLCNFGVLWIFLLYIKYEWKNLLSKKQRSDTK